MARILTEPISRALIVEEPHATLDEMLRRGGIEPHRIAAAKTEDVLVDAIHRIGAQVLFKRSRVPVTRSVLEACPSLFAVQLCCIGDDSVDKEACADHGVMVFNDPVSNGRSVVELVVGHLIALSRRLFETDQQMHSNRWNKSSLGRYEVLGKRVGIVGLGNIGRQVARVCEHLGMDVVFHDTRLVAQEVGSEFGWTYEEDLATLFRTTDIVTIHTSARDARGRDNSGMLDEVLGQIGADRDEASPRIFLNLARGTLYSPEALLEAVRAGHIRRAAVDVYPNEPAPGDEAWVNPYRNEPRIVCTPHIGAATQEAQPRIARRVAAGVVSFASRGSVRDCVFAPRVRLNLSSHPDAAAALAVVHSVSRGTKKAVDDAIYRAGVSNLGSVHHDFSVGCAYDLSMLDRPLSDGELSDLVRHAREISGDEHAIRTIRQVSLSDD